MKPNEIINELREYTRFEVITDCDLETFNQAANLIQSLTPRPIEEAPMDKFILGIFPEKDRVNVCYGLDSGNGFEQFSLCNTDDEEFTHFIPLSAIKALMESGE